MEDDGDAINYEDEEQLEGSMGQKISLFGFDTTSHSGPGTGSRKGARAATGGDDSKNHVVTHVRNYDNKQRAYFYMHSKSKATQWEIPTAGIVRCTAKDGQVRWT